MMNILGCLDTPTKGDYFIDDVHVSKLSNKATAKFRNQQIGFVLQRFALIEEDSAYDNVSIPLFFSKTAFARIDSLTTKTIEKINIGHLANRKVKNLSGGEKQRVAIARALINDPPIILADEPTGALDTKNSEMIMDILEALNKDGKTIIIITHEQNIAERCRNMITMADGQII